MSKKNAPLLMSAAGVIGGFFEKLVAKAKALGALDQLHELMVGDRSEEFISQVVGLTMKMVNTVHDGLCIVVDYSRSLAEMIKAGHYDWVNSDITDKHFPVKGSGKTKLVPEIIHYNKYMSSDAVIQDLDQRGLRPATLAELLAYGEKNPDEQHKYPIVALGSVWRFWLSSRDVACLCSFASERKLDLSYWDGGWHDHYRFLAFRK